MLPKARPLFSSPLFCGTQWEHFCMPRRQSCRRLAGTGVHVRCTLTGDDCQLNRSASKRTDVWAPSPCQASARLPTWHAKVHAPRWLANVIPKVNAYGPQLSVSAATITNWTRTLPNRAGGVQKEFAGLLSVHEPPRLCFTPNRVLSYRSGWRVVNCFGVVFDLSQSPGRCALSEV